LQVFHITIAAMRRLRRSAEWRFLAVFATAARGLAAAWWTLVALRGLLPAAFAIAMGSVVGAVEQHAPLGAPLVAAGAVFVVMNALGPVHDAIGSNLGAKSGAWLHDRLMDACLAPEGIGHLERPDLAEDLVAARDFDLGIAGPPLSTAVPQIGAGFAQFVGGVALAIVLARYSWWGPLLVGGAWASTHFFQRRSSIWELWRDDEVAKLRRHVDYAYQLAVSSPPAKEVRVFGLGDWLVERFTRLRRRLADRQYTELRLRQRPLALSMVLIVGANVIFFASLAHAARTGSISLRSLVVFAQAAAGASALAFGEWDWWFRGSAVPIPKVLDLAAGMAAAGGLMSGPRPADGLPARDVRFAGVSFTYPSSGVRVLDGFDLTIPTGSSLAIVGPNGAGKTTLAKLLCRLYDPDAGAVLVDDVDLRDLYVSSWRKRIAAVFQDYVRYELPLRDNVAPLGAPDVAVTRALELAGATEPSTLDTVLSRSYKDGTDLSGGQWQRVALARALCAVELGAGVVVLDEPTAQLDVRGELEIFDRILEATRGLTTILISHRFSTVRHADRICVLEHGRVVELGSHEELMQLGGRYRTMFDLQASRFYEEPAEEIHAG
jgi:ABC-type multidrug transport system fused ATPase/permease subunit